VTSDGAITLPNSGVPDIGTEPVTYLAAYPVNPTRSTTLSPESYDAGDRAWDVLVDPVPIDVDSLVGPSTPARPGAGPTSPFFLG